jgi:hypothetical protein
VKHFQFAVWIGAAIWRTIKPVLLFTTLLLLGLGALACRLTSSSPEAMTPSPLPPTGETPAAQQPTLARTATPPPSSTPSPTPTAEPTPTLPPTLTIEPAPALLAFKGPSVSYSGISFAVDPVLGDEVFVGTEPDSLSYVEFTFAPEGYCQDVGCVTIYPVESYRDGIPFGTDIIDELRSAIETQSNDYFPVLMAHILLRAKTHHLRFQNGAGIRAIVMKGQDTVYANNESVVYEFHGLTDDGQYYVAATLPIDAPMLLSACCDPAENTNEDAIPVPALPDDDVQAGAVIREYNREAQRQLDALDGSSFTPNLELLDALVGSLLITPSAELQVAIDYRGTWYRETFSYTREAENIAHFVLVMPESQVDRATADQVFSSIDFSTAPITLSIREGREEFAWTLEYVHDAPEGYFRGQFEPGTYYVAAAFVAAPLSREEAGQSDDDTLYVGMTGGGASTDYWKIGLEPGENAVTLSLTDKDGWACPWLYVYNGHFFERRTEILRNVRGKRNERTEVSVIGPVEIVDGAITFRVAEEKDEIAFVDELYIIVDGIEVHAEATTDVAARVAERDQHYLVIASSESREFRFGLPDSFTGRQQAAVSVVVSGFYVPLE